MINEFFHIFSEDVRFQVHRVTNLLFPKVVSLTVKGIRDTEKAVSVTSVSVRLMPSMAMEPFSPYNAGAP